MTEASSPPGTSGWVEKSDTRFVIVTCARLRGPDSWRSTQGLEFKTRRHAPTRSRSRTTPARACSPDSAGPKAYQARRTEAMPFLFPTAVWAHLGTAPADREPSRFAPARRGEYAGIFRTTLAGPPAADGDRPRSGGSIEMRPHGVGCYLIFEPRSGALL